MSEPSFSSETIYAALFALVSGVSDFAVKTRRLKTYASAPQDVQPCFYQSERGAKFEGDLAMPPLVTLQATLFIYCFEPNPDENVSPQINTLLDAVVNALAPDDTDENLQTLGGLVYQCRIAGEIKIAEGLTGQSEVQIPVEILVNH